MIHVYLVFNHDCVKEREVTSSMVSGWTIIEKPGPTQHTRDPLPTPGKFLRDECAKCTRHAHGALCLQLPPSGGILPLMNVPPPTRILGVGNPLMGDDGAGIHAFRRICGAGEGAS